MEEENTIAQEVSNVIADAMFKAKEAKGIVIAIATEHGGVMTFGAGEFVVRLGLYHALQEEARETWDDAEEGDTE